MDTLVLDGIKKCYGQTIALDGFSATLTHGICGVLGENGAGKSTVLNLLSTLIQPDQGMILYNGSTIYTRYYQSLLGYLPQHFGVYGHMKLQDYLRYVAALKNVDGSTIDPMIQTTLNDLDLLPYADSKLKTLSGGMRQRVGIAQALINSPKVLLLDEPTVGLDPRQRIRFKTLLSRLANHCIVILSSHIVSDIEDIADTVWLLKKGKLCCEGTVESLIKSLDGTVYVKDGDTMDLPLDATIVNIRLKPIPMVRFISNALVQPSWRMVRPDLNDVYMRVYDVD